MAWSPVKPAATVEAFLRRPAFDPAAEGGASRALADIRARGAARMFSGLTGDDFRRRSSILRYTRDNLLRDLPAIQTFGDVEGLDACKRSAEIRFQK